MKVISQEQKTFFKKKMIFYNFMLYIHFYWF